MYLKGYKPFKYKIQSILSNFLGFLDFVGLQKVPQCVGRVFALLAVFGGRLFAAGANVHGNF